jgi:hypothetical protein
MSLGRRVLRGSRARTHQAPRTTHHAPRTTHRAPRTAHHAPHTTHHAPRTTRTRTRMQGGAQGSCSRTVRWARYDSATSPNRREPTSSSRVRVPIRRWKTTRFILDLCLVRGQHVQRAMNMQRAKICATCGMWRVACDARSRDVQRAQNM